MKKVILIGFAALFLLTATSFAAEQRPAAVSPASDMGIARVGEICPTFSWTTVEGAVVYRLEVFRAGGDRAPTYDQAAAASYPVLVKEIRGAATTWTPSTDERLVNGDTYVWFVQAIDAYGGGAWSEGQLFKVEVTLDLAPIEESVRETLEENGVEQAIIDDVLGNVDRAAQQAGLKVPTSLDGSTPINIQGTEGTVVTKFGYLAGASQSNYYGVFVGTHAGENTTTPWYNTFIGHRAGELNVTGANNSFLGAYAGYSSTGNNNCMFGYNAGSGNTSGSYNTLLGYYAGYTNGDGAHNVMLGYYAGRNSAGGDYNTFLGNYAGYEIDGNNNTVVGYRAGYTNTSGSGNVFLGNEAGYYETGSNKLYIDNSGVTNPLIWGDFSSDIVAVNGNFGVGTQSPSFPMVLERNGSNGSIVVVRTDGATNYINATASYGNFGTVTSHPLRLVANSVWRMRLDTDNSLTMANGATCTAGGTWVNASSRDLKENIHELTYDDARDALEGLNPVRYNYKADAEDEFVGFIAEDAPELVATKDKKGMSSMDVVAVLTKVLKEQQKINEELKAGNEELKASNEELRKEMAELKEQVKQKK
jgi:hypothetical protein